MIDVFGFGASGHAKVVIEIIQLNNEYNIVGLLEKDKSLHTSRVSGIPVLGDDDYVDTLKQRGVERFFVGVGCVKSVNHRSIIYDLAIKNGLTPINIIHKSAHISASVRYGEGLTVGPGVGVNADTVLGYNVILNTGCIVEHDCKIGNHVHIASTACLSGLVKVGDRTHIGAGAVVKQGISIGSDVTVGIGSVVVKDIPNHTTVVGNPARVLAENAHAE